MYVTAILPLLTYPQAIVDKLLITLALHVFLSWYTLFHIFLLNVCHIKANAVWVYIEASLDQRGGGGYSSLPFSPPFLRPSLFINYIHTTKILTSIWIFIFLYVYNTDIQIGIKKRCKETSKHLLGMKLMQCKKSIHTYLPTLAERLVRYVASIGKSTVTAR